MKLQFVDFDVAVVTLSENKLQSATLRLKDMYLKKSFHFQIICVKATVVQLEY